jgi:hypothetical protein
VVRIVCEGIDDENFIKKLLIHLKVKDKSYSFNQHLQSTGGKSHLLKTTTYDNNNLNQEIGKSVKKVLFIFDADFEEDNNNNGGLEKSNNAIKKLIQDLNWNIPTDYYIFDNNLDDFIIKTLDKEQQKCFKKFDKCLKIEIKNKNKKISTCIYKKLYPQKPYDFSHQNFTELKAKLKDLFNE